MNPLAIVTELGAKLIDKLFPDPKQKAEATLRLMELQQSGDLAQIAGQIELDKMEASNPKLFVSGWRPFVGWVCASGLAIQFILAPVLEWGSTLAGTPLKLPPLDMSVMLTLLVGMLGLGGMRTVERLNGVART